MKEFAPILTTTKDIFVVDTIMMTYRIGMLETLYRISTHVLSSSAGSSPSSRMDNGIGGDTLLHRLKGQLLVSSYTLPLYIPSVNPETRKFLPRQFFSFGATFFCSGSSLIERPAGLAFAF
jgi:hypothetical protein